MSVNPDAVRAAFDLALQAMDVTLPTRFGHKSYTPPAGPYQWAVLPASTPDDATLGDGPSREEGFYQVMLCYPDTAGDGEILRRVHEIKESFKRGRVLQQAGVRIVVTATPTMYSGLKDGNRWCVPVRIFWFAEVGI